MVLWKLYLSHSLSCWGDSTWWFIGGLYTMKLSNIIDDGSLRLTAVYGLVLALSFIVFGASIGRWIDRTERLYAAKVFLGAQNSSVAACCALFTFLLRVPTQMPFYLWFAIGVTVALLTLSAISKCASQGARICLEKDWIVVIASGDVNALAKINSILRTIELVAFVLSPLAMGQFVFYLGYEITGLFVAAWNITSMVIEYFLLKMVYKDYPNMSYKAVEVEEYKSRSLLKKILGSNEGWMLYLKHPVRYAGLGLAFLYNTVLGFDNITYGYLLMQRVSESILGIMAAIASIVGALGSLMYPCIRRRIGLERTGLIGMFLLVSFSSLSVLSVFIPGSPFLHKPRTKALNEMTDKQKKTIDIKHLGIDNWNDNGSVIVLLIGITLARLGLWITDLTINQILQENVEEDNRGTISGVQESLNNSFDLLKCILVILLPYEHEFGILIIISYISICTGWLSYAIYSHKRRGHLFHFSKVIQLFNKPKKAEPERYNIPLKTEPDHTSEEKEN